MPPSRKSSNPKSEIRIPQSCYVGVVIAAGGSGVRLASDVPKQFLELGGKPILVRTIESILALDQVREVVVALPARHLRLAKVLLAKASWRVPVRCVRGGATRQESVFNGVKRIHRDADVILVHDAVRPLCDRETMERVLAAASAHGGAVPGVQATDTIQRVAKAGRIRNTPPRHELYAIQTPQGFRASILRAALERAARKKFLGTDESSVVRWAGHRVCVVPGSPDNLKITRPLDLGIAEMILADSTRAAGTTPRGEKMTRIGHGIDYHRLVGGRKLILGGVEISFEKGLEGHSDADVLTHAICDALLGASGLGDIGRHFPDTDAEHRGRSSMEFLSEIRELLRARGWAIRNVDATILAQRPKLSPFMEEMRGRIAKSLDVSGEIINIKATTTEGMNAEGRGEGISAQAIALLEKSD